MKKLTKHSPGRPRLALSISSGALADDSNDRGKGCTPAILHGLYIFAATGYTMPASPAPAQPKAIVEFIHFNGDGTLTVPAASRSLNGVYGQSPPGGLGLIPSRTLSHLTEPARAHSRLPEAQVLICSCRAEATRFG